MLVAGDHCGVMYCIKATRGKGRLQFPFLTHAGLAECGVKAQGVSPMTKSAKAGQGSGPAVFMPSPNLRHTQKHQDSWY